MTLSYFEAFLKSIEVHSLMDVTILKSDYISLNLSIHNPELKAVNISSSKDLEVFIWNYMKTNKAKVAFGGYLEKRGIYQRSTYFNQQKPEEERSIHLGIDIWDLANTPVYSILKGNIHSINYNDRILDYGGTIITKHNWKNTTFHCLYGHLSKSSLTNKIKGMTIDKGEQLGFLGAYAENGGWPPHLHFQIIVDMEDWEGDYPGVAAASKLDYYKNNSSHSKQ